MQRAEILCGSAGMQQWLPVVARHICPGELLMNACSKCALAGSLFFLLSTLPVTLPDTVSARPTTMGQLSSINNKLTKTGSWMPI